MSTGRGRDPAAPEDRSTSIGRASGCAISHGRSGRHALIRQGVEPGPTHVTCAALTGMRDVLAEVRPDRVLVHGDPTTALAAALAAYYAKVPVGHVEALRTGDRYAPWPEEMNRRIADAISDRHFGRHSGGSAGARQAGPGDAGRHRLAAIASGAAPTAEEDVNDLLVRTVVAAGTLRTAATPQPADAFIIAVPTPHGPDHAPDVSFVRTAVESLAPSLRSGNLVVLESTSPVGTTEQLCAWLAESRGDLSFPHEAGADSDVRVAYSPERAIPGNMLHELTNNDRGVGGITGACAAAPLLRADPLE